MFNRVRLKVCCISSVEDARLAVAAGADAIGLVGRMPSGPGPIPDELIHEIAATVPPPVATFLLTSETEPDAVVQHIQRTGVNTVQLVDDAVTLDVYSALRDAHPTVRIVQVIHVNDWEAVDRGVRTAPYVDALLLDSGKPRATRRQLGGTGRAHDWSVSREIVSQCTRPVFLAGGLNADNVGAAIKRVRPFGIDLCSGVRTDGRLDPEKLRAFVAAMDAST